ncbi:hypothetical protein GCM10027612_74040 [Microbispora bryophytorum subsp. camponoti]
MWGGLVDLPADTRSAHLVRTALTAPGHEEEIAIRPAGLFGRRLVTAPRPEPAAEPWRPRGTVLVTGGTGGLGAHVARWLAAAGADHLVLVSRRGRSAPGAEALETELTAAGAAVTIAACDVADRAALAGLIATVTAGHGPIRSVFHTAGVGRRVPIAELTADELAAACTKAAGAANLDDLLGESALDAFVLFSSIAGTGVWATTGQAAYAAANAFLDALAERRRALGRTATSLAWGLWAGPGMGADPAFARHLARHGVEAMPPERAIAALQAALDDDATCLTVADIAWERFVPPFTAGRTRPLLDDLAAAREALSPPADAPDQASGPGLRQELAALPAVRRRPRILQMVLGHTAAISGDSAGATDPSRPFRDLGFDSLMTVELPERLTAATGLALPATLAYDHPTPAAVADHLYAELTGERSPVAGPAGATSASEDPIAIVAMSCRYPGGVRSPRICGTWSPPVPTRCRSSPPTVDGTSTACTTRRARAPARRTRTSAASSTTRESSTPRSSTSARARPSRWTRNSGCCSRSRGRPWNAPGSTPPPCATATPASSSEPRRTSTAAAARTFPRTSPVTC